jgi:hypothetical protein
MTTLKWTKIDEYHIRTDGYTITKAKINDITVYTAFKLPNTILGNFKSLQDAKNCITEHNNDEHKAV